MADVEKTEHQEHLERISTKDELSPQNSLDKVATHETLAKVDLHNRQAYVKLMGKSLPPSLRHLPANVRHLLILLPINLGTKVTIPMARYIGLSENGLRPHSWLCCTQVRSQPPSPSALRWLISFAGSQILLYFTGGTLSYIAADLGNVGAIGWLPVANTLAIASVCPFG